MEGTQVAPADSSSTGAHRYAFVGDRSKLANYVQAHPASVDALDRKGYTPLFYACHRGNVECVELLVQNGADVSYISPNGRSLLMESAIGVCIFTYILHS